jgi:hypothetical protein
MSPARAPGSELFAGGPPHHLGRLLGLGAGVARRAHPALLGVLIGWAPLALLATVQSLALGTAGWGSFLGDEAVCGPPLDAIARHFLDAGLVAGAERPRFEAALASTRRWVHSRAAGIVLLGLAYALTVWFFLSLPPAVYPAWQLRGTAAASADSFFRGLSVAGWWNALVSAPLLLLLTLGWLWRLWLWARLLWLISRMDLRLISSHPDRCAGLKFVGYSLRGFAIVALALGCIGAGRTANLVAQYGVSPFAHRNAIIAGTAVVVALFLAPLLVFTPKLLVEWQRGVFEYGALADRLGRSLERKWFDPERAADPAALEVQDFSATIDAYSVVAGVHVTHFVPVDWKSIALLAAAVLLPFIPLALLTLPLDTILRAVARFFV